MGVHQGHYLYLFDIKRICICVLFAPSEPNETHDTLDYSQGKANANIWSDREW